jgi:hypothetical protein
MVSVATLAHRESRCDAMRERNFVQQDNDSMLAP